MANRYTQITPSQFNPLSMKEIFTVPLAKQAKHDTAQAKLDELGLFDINRLSEDEGTAKEYIDQYTGKIDTEIDTMLSQGINNNTSRKIRGLISERKKWMSKGQPGGQIVANYEAYNANKKDLDKLYQSGKISRDKYLLGLQDARSNYKGVAEGDTYSAFNPVLDIDIEAEANKIAEDIGNNPVKITEFSGLKYIPKLNKYVDVKTNRTYNPEGAIALGVEAGLRMNQGLMSDLNQRISLGLPGYTTSKEYFKGLGALGQLRHGKDNFQTTKQYIGKAKVDDTTSGQPSDRNYSFGIAQEVKNPYFSSLSTKLERMIAGDTISTATQLNMYGTGISYRDPSDAINKPYSLNDEQQVVFDNISQDLIKTNQIPLQDRDDPTKVQQYVKDYVDMFQDIDFQNVYETSGLYRTYEKRGAKINKLLPEDLAKSIHANAHRTIFLDNNTVKTLDKLSNSQQDQINNKEFTVTGVLTPKNFLRQQVVKDPVNDRLLTSPIEIKLNDGTILLVGRQESELDTPKYKADTEFGKIWNEITLKPFRPYSTILEDTNVDIVKRYRRDSDNKLIKDINGKPIIEDIIISSGYKDGVYGEQIKLDMIDSRTNDFFRNKDGSLMFKSPDDQLQAIIYSIHNIN